MALELPFPGIVFVPLDMLTAERQNQIVANYTYIASQFPIGADNIDWANLTYEVGETIIKDPRLFVPGYSSNGGKNLAFCVPMLKKCGAGTYTVSISSATVSGTDGNYVLSSVDLRTSAYNVACMRGDTDSENNYLRITITKTDGTVFQHAGSSYALTGLFQMTITRVS